MTDLHTRKLRYFIAVAEELHFSRAAERLFLAQQALSRQIRELEDELGFPLFIRSTRKVELTAAGAVFLDGARAALEALDTAATMALRANRTLTGTLRLGFYPGAALELTEPILAAFRVRHPDVVVEMQEYPVSDPSAGLANGSSDIAIVRTPMADEGLETEALFTEPTVVAVSVRHRFAGRVGVSVADVLGEAITVSNSSDDRFRSFWLLEEFRGGTRPPQIVVTRSVTEEVSLVSTGSAVAVTAAAATRYVSHPGIRYVPITDGPRSTVSLAWRAGDDTSLVQRFRATAIDVRDQETDLLGLIESPVMPAT